LLLMGCSESGGGGDDAAVRQGVIDHLSTKAALNVDLMEIEVTSVEYEGDLATASVTFQAKGSDDPAAAMQMQYTLERKGSRWVVQAKAGAEGSPHGGGGGGMANPHGGMPPAEGGEMPSGHPPTEAPPAEVQN
jgi:hypothetical protein